MVIGWALSGIKIRGSLPKLASKQGSGRKEHRTRSRNGPQPRGPNKGLGRERWRPVWWSKAKSPNGIDTILKVEKHSQHYLVHRERISRSKKHNTLSRGYALRKQLGLKWVGNTTRQLTPKKRASGKGLFGVHLLIFHFKFQFFKSNTSSTFHIFLNLTYPLRKKYPAFPKMPKHHPNIYTKPPNSDYDYKHRDLELLET